jgi:hypothetical protein
MLTYNYSVLQRGFVVYDTVAEKVVEVYEDSPQGMDQARNHVKEADQCQIPTIA